MRLIGLDVGDRRIGVAKVDTDIRIAIPHCTIIVDGTEFVQIQKIARNYNSDFFVIGLPRNSAGVETVQSAKIRAFAKELKKRIPNAKIRLQDETLTSVEAENRLKSRGKPYQKGDIDAEAATIILQDLVEEFTTRMHLKNSTELEESNLEPSAKSPDIEQPSEPISKTKNTPSSRSKPQTVQKLLELNTPSLLKRFFTKVKLPKLRNLPKPKFKIKLKSKHFVILAITIAILGLAAIIATIFWYFNGISALTSKEICEKHTSACKEYTLKIESGTNLAQILTTLAQNSIIRDKNAFQLYAKLNKQGSNIKAGVHKLNSSMSAQEIFQALNNATNADVFNFTILPGETIFDIKAKLQQYGYGSLEIDTAFAKQYNHPILKNKPAAASLEGYLYGETYNFFNGEQVENIIKRALDQTQTIVQQNNLEELFSKRNLTLHQGLTLASIIQKETKTDHATVAQIFEKRLRQNDQLGSDVTVTYAIKVLDPERKIYRNNAQKLEIDSPYNTRKHAGLPPTPIASPSIQSLKAVANPADTDYYYFLTGDDGKMYYSKTIAEHNSNIRNFCQKLCAVEL